MITLGNTSCTREFGESVLFQPVLNAYPMCHSWLITVHISLGHLECHWKSFNRQMHRTHQLLQSLGQCPSTPTQLLATLQVELTNITDIYTSYKPIIIQVINLLDTDPSLDGHSNYNSCVKRNLLPFLGNALIWLTGTATSKDVDSIKQSKSTYYCTVNSTRSYSTLCIHPECHEICSTSQQTTHQHCNGQIWWNSSWCQPSLQLDYLTWLAVLSYYQIILHIRSILANPRDSLSYIRTVSMHTVDYIDAATFTSHSTYFGS